MKPNFALSLSFEGIRLLHRAAGGWRSVGEVALSAEDLAAELNSLHATANALSPDDLRSKLIIPNDQIKYLTIDTPDMSPKERQRAAEDALMGATPYAIDELAFDISEDGPKTHIAAVARETLREAEAFAQEHKFNPVSFVSIPGDAPYLGEPFFGVTEGAKALLTPDETVEPDGIAVVVVGDAAIEPAPEKNEEPAEQPPVQDADETKAPEVDLELQEPEPDNPILDDEPEIAKAEPDIAEQKASEVETIEAEALSEPPLAADEDVTINHDETRKHPSEVDDYIEADFDDTAREDSPPEIEDLFDDLPTASDFQAQEELELTADDPLVSPVEAPISEPPTPTPTPTPTPIPNIDAKFSATSVLSGASISAPSIDLTDDETAAPETPRPDFAATAFVSKRSNGPALPAATRGIETPAVTTPPEPDSSSFDIPKPEPAQAVTPKAAKKSGKVVDDEAERMTIFGERDKQVGGKPKFLGLILTLLLLLFLAGAALWATMFADKGTSGLWGNGETRVTASAPENQVSPEVIIEPATAPEDPVEVATPNPTLSPEDDAVLDALAEPEAPVITEAEAEARYAVTGIWPLAPRTPTSAPHAIDLGDVYITTLDPKGGSSDAIALPAASRYDTDRSLGSIASPPPAGTKLALDAQGMLLATPQGTLSPNGYMVFAGSPPLKPPARNGNSSSAISPEDQLAQLRPRTRPSGFAERAERARTGGLTRNELQGYRPRLRPKSVQEAAEDAALNNKETERAIAAATASLQTPAEQTRIAVASSLRPDTRPQNFARIVKRAARTKPPKETRTAAAVAPRTVAPRIPSNASVSRSATQRNAINLRRVSLIGVYGKPSNRRALVRMANGRFRKVVIGDRLDGGRVSAIGNDSLRYRKGSRDLVLKMP